MTRKTVVLLVVVGALAGDIPFFVRAARNRRVLYGERS